MKQKIYLYETESQKTDTLFTTCKDVSNPPSKEDINETVQLLREFGINIQKKNVPIVTTLFDLHLWRKSKIKAYLQN